MRTFFSILVIILLFQRVGAQSNVIDVVYFGNPKSEKRHQFASSNSELRKSQPSGHWGRILLPISGERVEGGNLSVRMKVLPEQQNYCTVKLSGSDLGNENILILFCEGKQVGYRHLGDIDVIDRSTSEASAPGKDVYVTIPLPLNLTNNKKEVILSIRSTGKIWGYGDSLDKYQRPMDQPSRGIYEVYTHVDPYLNIESNTEKGWVNNHPVRPESNEKVLDTLKNYINDRISSLLGKPDIVQNEIWFLSEAYDVGWSAAYNNPQVIAKTIALADKYVERYEKDPRVVYEDAWVTTGPLCLAIYRFIPEILPVLDETMPNGKSRRENWTKLFKACVDYANSHRRAYTNQSMIVDWNLHEVNRILSWVAPEQALPAYQTLRYLYESIGLSPWLGNPIGDDFQRPLGDSYYQATKMGLTKELGFVGSYGEILNWVVRIYESTGERGQKDTRDPLIRGQLLKMLRARSYFRYPSVDREGYRAMRAETVIGWRDGGNYPGGIIYGERGDSRESTPFMVAASTLDPEAIAYAQQMMDDNQFYNVVSQKLKDKGIHSALVSLRIPDEYALLKQQQIEIKRLPMSPQSPDFVFADTENGVVAFKNGEDIFYTSLYWRANYAINYLARVHYITPQREHIATIYQDVKYEDSGLTYSRPERTNMFFSDARDFYKNVRSAHTGEVLPIAKIPDGISFRAGNESVFAGKGKYYTLTYGKYCIAMNCTSDESFELNIPFDHAKAFDLTNGTPVGQKTVLVEPGKTLVIELRQ